MPKKFIAGTLYDPTEEEVVIGADCTLTGAGGGGKYTVSTNSYGDFWFEGLSDGKFRLEIKSGGKVKVFDGLDTTDADINLGDIPLT